MFHWFDWNAWRAFEKLYRDTPTFKEYYTYCMFNRKKKRNKRKKK